MARAPRPSPLAPLLACAVSLALAGCGADAPGSGAASPDTDLPPDLVLPPLDGDRVPRGLVPGRPDVVLITIDTLRADRLGCYGYPRDTSPNLDALAADGLRFERCLTPVSTTLPAHTSLLTGTTPYEHGVLSNLKGRFVFEREPSLRLLSEWFADLGYVTGAFVSAVPLRAETGIDAGFSMFDAPKAARHERPAELTLRNARTWLRLVEGPVFLWVHLFDPHGPYEAPAPFRRHFTPDATLERWMDERAVSVAGERKHGKEVDSLGANNAYDCEVAYTDHELGLFLDHLRERGRWDETVVIVVGDHGEGLNQHGEPGHGQTWDEQLRVPLIVRAPGLAPGVVERPLSLEDLAPTLLHLLDLPRQEAFLAQVTGVDRLEGGHPVEPLLGQSSPRQATTDVLDHSVTTTRWKYVRTGDGAEHLFDLVADPHELRDVLADHPDEAAWLRLWLRDELADLATRAGGSTRAASAAERASLEALGYGGDSDDDPAEGGTSPDGDLGGGR